MSILACLKVHKDVFMQWKQQKGVVTVETAIVLPVLFMIVFGLIQFAWLMNNKQILADVAIIGANALASERGATSPYCDAVGAPGNTEKTGGTSCSSCLVNSTTAGTPNCLNQIYPAIKAYSGGAMTSANVTVTMKVGTFPIPANGCSSDSTCITALGSVSVPPAAGTVTAVSLSYTFTPLINLPKMNLSAYLSCGGGSGANSTTCTLISPTAYAVVQ
jgi:Flp pilus assembly protein TadG